MQILRRPRAPATAAGSSFFRGPTTTASAFQAGIGTLLLLGSLAGGARAADPAGVEILQDLKAFRETGSVLYVAAHPDDENTQLITFLARGRGCRTAYLSLTRGDGGQNVIGSEFGDALGLIRTHELLAARRLDKGRQFFTRALDFGFSKDYRETLRVWDEKQVVGDIVRVIRTFRPDVIITRFSPEPGGTHGHHTASARLAIEAFKLAGDPAAYPEQLSRLNPWQPKRILQNGRGGNGNDGSIRLDVSGTDPVLGETFARIANRSRAMHVSQGFGDFGGNDGGGPRTESFQPLAGEPATKDLLDGVDTSWARYPGGAKVVPLIDKIIRAFDPNSPAASVDALLDLRWELATLPADPVVDEKRQSLDRILQACLGLAVRTTVPRAQVVAGEQFQLRHTVSVRAAVPVRWTAVRYPAIAGEVRVAVDLQPGRAETRQSAQTLPATTPITQPYWLRRPGTPGMARVDDPELIGRPINPPTFPVEYVLELSGQTLILPEEPVQEPTADDPAGAEPARLAVIPPIALRPLSDVRLFAPGGTKTVEVEIVASRPNVSGNLRLRVPEGWRVEPTSQAFGLAAAGERKTASFTVTAPPTGGEATLTAAADVNGATFDTRLLEIRYKHIPPLLLQPVAKTKAVALDLKTTARRVGYLPGAGDSVAECLQEMGCAVTRLTGADLTPERLAGLDAVVIGVRALNVRTDLADRMPALFAFVENGGNVVMQYNQPNGLKVDPIAPFTLRLSRDRVTEEDAPVTFLAPGHPALNTPNNITPADFEHWVQERGLYFANGWDERFTPLLASNDTGEPPLKGGLLVARYGRGYFVYSGLAWFRQLPAGVPGAYRLFANVLSLGK